MLECGEINICIAFRVRAYGSVHVFQWNMCVLARHDFTHPVWKSKTHLVKLPRNLLEYLYWRLKFVFNSWDEMSRVPFSLTSLQQYVNFGPFCPAELTLACVTLIPPNPNSLGCSALLLQSFVSVRLTTHFRWSLFHGTDRTGTDRNSTLFYGKDTDMLTSF